VRVLIITGGGPFSPSLIRGRGVIS
jgi:hypothetical protein